MVHNDNTTRRGLAAALHIVGLMSRWQRKMVIGSIKNETNRQHEHLFPEILVRNQFIFLLVKQLFTFCVLLFIACIIFLNDSAFLGCDFVVRCSRRTLQRIGSEIPLYLHVLTSALPQQNQTRASTSAGSTRYHKYARVGTYHEQTPE